MPRDDIARADHSRRSLRYASDVTDREWELLALFKPEDRDLGRPRTTGLREVMNAILYIDTTGCPWRYLPTDFPPASTVQRYFYRWRDGGLWTAVNGMLVTAARELEGREASPTEGVIDSQSVKTREAGGVAGYDAGKRIKEGERHIGVDTLGLMVGLIVHGADVQHHDGDPAMLASVRGRWPAAPHHCGRRLRWGEAARRAERSGRLERRDHQAIRLGRRLRSSIPDAGSSSAPSPGSDDADGWRRTGRRPSLHPKPR